jgi:hypothetical protein
MSMTNSQGKIVSDSKPEGNPDLLPGTFNDDAVTRGLLTDSIKKSGLSREQIAERMSWLLSTRLTADMLNNFTADGKVSHRFPFAWSRAFCESTGDWRLLHYIAEQSGFILLNKDDAEVLTLGEQVIEREQAETEIKRIARNVIERRSRR